MLIVGIILTTIGVVVSFAVRLNIHNKAKKSEMNLQEPNVIRNKQISNKLTNILLAGFSCLMLGIWFILVAQGVDILPLSLVLGGVYIANIYLLKIAMPNSTKYWKVEVNDSSITIWTSKTKQTTYQMTDLKFKRVMKSYKCIYKYNTLFTLSNKLINAEYLINKIDKQ